MINIFIIKAKDFIVKNQHYLSSGAFLLGFIVDSITLPRIDLWFSNVILFFYLLLAGISILIFNTYNERVQTLGKFARHIVNFSPIIMQYAFGGLFSGYLVFYMRSASLVASWFFIFLLVSLFVGNEFFKKHYISLNFQISIFFLTVLSFSIFYIPILLGSVGAWIFVLSSVLSVVVILAFIYLIFLITPHKITEHKNKMFVSIGVIFISMNILYFTNIIPPIPLALKDIGVYHLVERKVTGEYVAWGEEKKWYKFLEKYDKAIENTPGESVYLYSAIFSPTTIDTEIFHKWQYFDKKKEKWITTDLIRFEIVGGRDGGYRGYTKKSNIKSGKWRVDVVTKRDQLLGRASFDVVYTSERPKLTEDIK